MAFDFQSFLSRLTDPRYFRENRLAAHSSHAFYRNEEELLVDTSSLCRSLRGLWQFAYARNLAAIPQDFWADEVDCHDWENIRVPAHLQMEGYGTPHYTNTTYPWDGKEAVQPPQVPKRENPVGCYVRYFDVPQGWENLYISFTGVESALALFLNGHFVGYSEDGMTPSDFDLTPYMRAGENKLAAMVFRYASSSWLEDQDFWRFSGIFRDVVLYTKPTLHVEDMEVKAVPVENYTAGDLSLKLLLAGKATGTVNLTLYDAQGKVIYEKTQATAEGEISFVAHIPHVRLWSAENPYLYEAVLVLKDSTEKTVEVTRQAIGFREFKLNDGLMKINGKRIVFKGVNRHPWDCHQGRVLAAEVIEKDIQEMKRHNINALRTSHYPNESILYDLCDRYGLYVIDEANVETHGSWMRNGQDAIDAHTVPNDNKDWEGAVLDRAESMLERDKNHPCVLIWSLGNESAGGSVFYRVSEWLRHRDPSRLIHYEGIFHDRRFAATSDMESQMYTKVKDIEAFLQAHKEKPFICCEYAHAMGESIGGMAKYTELTEREPRYQGGFIWDFIDQAIEKDGHMFYGGDFGDRPTDGNFCGDGLYLANRQPTSKLQEVKFDYQNFKLKPDWDGVTIRNLSLFTNTAQYDLHVTLRLEGRVVWEKQIPAPAIAPNEEGRAELPLPRFSKGEAVVLASFVLKEATLWANAGHVVATGETILPPPKTEAKNLGALLLHRTYNFAPPCLPNETKTMRVTFGDICIGVAGMDFSYLFSTAVGNLVSYKHGGVEFLQEPPAPNFWRAPVDNDYGNNRARDSAQWKLASLYRRMKAMAWRLDDGDWQEINGWVQGAQHEVQAKSFEVRFVYELFSAPRSEVTLTYRILPQGVAKVSLDYRETKGLPDIPDFAMLFTLPVTYKNVRLYGRGPAANYRDRKGGAYLAIHEFKVQNEQVYYLLPQTCGNHVDTRWLEAVDDKGRGLRLWSDVPFESSALPYTPQELENARHAYDLPKPAHTILRASRGMCGIGGDDTWGAPVLEEYTCKNQIQSFSFWMQGV